MSSTFSHLQQYYSIYLTKVDGRISRVNRDKYPVHLLVFFFYRY